MAKQKMDSGAGQGGFRQAQAWLHTWCGLWFSWLLFAVFLTGTLAVFDDPISHWMTPEHHAEEAAAEQAKKEGSVPPSGSLGQRLAWSVAYMEKQHPGAGMWELWPVDAEGAGDLRVYWFDKQQQYASVDLDPATGEPLRQEKNLRHARPWAVITLSISTMSCMLARWACGLLALRPWPCWSPWSAV